MHNKYFKMKNYSNIFKATDKNLKKAANILKTGGLVALPTETVYGLAGNAYNNSSVKKIYKLKNRPKKNPLIVHFDNLKSIEKETEFNPYLRKLYKKFSPGPLTYVLKLKKNSKISKLLLNQNKTIACRVPANTYFRKVIKYLSSPVAAPSANISNQLSPTSAKDVQQEFGKKLKFILDGKNTKIGLESSVINLIGKPKILRPGFITQQELVKIIRNIKKNNSKIILSPGQLKKHYSPGIPVFLNQTKPKKNGAFLVFGKTKLKGSNIYYLSKKSSLVEAAKKLYAQLRKIKNAGYRNISITKIPNKNIGIAINDRIKKAAQ